MQDVKKAVPGENYSDGARAVPLLEVPEFSYEVRKPYKVQQTIEVDHFGYSAPSEQTSYDGAGAVHLHLHGGYGNGAGI